MAPHDRMKDVMKGDPIRIIPHRIAIIPDIGSFEVRFADGRDSVHFHWDDHPGRRAMSMSTTMDQATAKAAAQALARSEMAKLAGNGSGAKDSSSA